MTGQELIHTYIQFFVKKGHTRIEVAPLATDNESSTLFNSAGMQPLVPYLAGRPHPGGRRLVNVQPCLRTVDIDEVGDASHLTFFEMLGNWSLGDYFKAESIEMSLEFLTAWLKIEPQRLWVTVFAGDQAAPPDDESPRIWAQLGLPVERIVPLGREDNWWGPVGSTGPCGPDTEIFFELDRPACSPICAPGCKCGRFLEIWNNVFMTYHRTADGRYEPLAQQNVDTGLGVDRVAAVLQGQPSVFETELFASTVEQIHALAAGEAPLQFVRVIADHLKAATFILGEGIQPSNKRQGYVARRLIRRAIDHGKRIGISGSFTTDIAETVIELYHSRYPHLGRRRPEVLDALQAEEKAFNQTLRRGRRIFEQQIEQVQSEEQSQLSGADLFHLFETYGIPVEMAEEWAAEFEVGVDIAGFEQALAIHKEVSGGGHQGEFAGGLAAHDQQTVRLHTATHLLHQALRDVLGLHIAQKGSHITPQRLRFDFSHPAKLTSAEISQVERLVNTQIEADLPVRWAEMPLAEAKAGGAIGLFEEKYGEQVRVYSIGDYSREICGGPHVERTGVLGRFRILREQSNGTGIRRIRAVVAEKPGE
jgi:alanyl-tRNA synthetase